MVRLNKQSEFQFPFLASETSSDNQLSKINQLDFVDKILLLFASTIFFAIVLTINFEKSPSNNSLSGLELFPTFHPSMEYVIPPELIENEEIEVQPKIDEPISNNNILALVPNNINTKVLAPASNTKQSNTNFSLKKETKKVSKSTEKLEKKKLIFNQSIKAKKDKKSIFKPSTQTKKVSPKPVFVELEMENQDLTINEKVTLDLLPASYFLAKEKASQEGKLMYIKFGAKWCLPCQQMEKTTFKNKKVKDFAEKNYVSLAIDVEDFEGVNMQSYFNVKFLPTLLIFNSQGNFIAKYINYQSAASMLEILEKHKLEQQKFLTSVPSKIEASPKLIPHKIKKAVSIDFNQVILSKKKNGKAIKSLKSKAKNWRYTYLDFSSQHFSEGELILKVKEITTGQNLTELKIPMMKNQRVADTTTTDFQLVLEHKKRKDKNGEYVVEIYHNIQNELTLVGKTTLLKDGEILF